MSTRIYIIAIAAVLVVTKLILEHQHNNDILNNEEDDPSTYTLWGMLKSMFRKGKERKREKSEKTVRSSDSLQIQKFSHSDESLNNDAKNEEDV